MRHLPVRVVLVLVVAPQRGHGPQADGVGEEYLGPSIDPYLGRVRGEGGKEREKETLEPAAWRRWRGSLATGP